jgi:DHA1 family bicyclomycin/chloramphenicol resistance-like MFS transporter
MTQQKSTARSLLPIIILLTIFGQLSADAYLPVMPNMTLQLHTSSLLMQISITVFFFSFALSQLLTPLFSPYLSYRHLSLIALCLLSASNLLCAFTHSMIVFIILRSLTGLGAGLSNVLARTLLVQHHHGQQLNRYSSYMYLAWTMVPMIAPYCGGLIATTFNWQSIFYCLSVISILPCIFIYSIPNPIDNTTMDTSPHTFFQHYKTIIVSKNKYYMHMLLCVCLSFSTMITLLQGLPFFLSQVYHFSTLSISWILAALGTATLLGLFLNLFLLKNFKRTNIIYGGLFLMVAASLSSLYYEHQWTTSILLLFILSCLYLLRMSTSLILPNCQAIALSIHPNLASYASAFFGFFTYFFTFFISYAVAHLPHNSLWPLLATLFVETLMCLTIFLLRPHND